MNNHLLRTHLYLFVWLFLTVFFVGSMFFAYSMGWTDERLIVLLAGAIGASIQAIAMLTNTASKTGNRFSDIPLATGETMSATQTTTVQTEETVKTKEEEKP